MKVRGKISGTPAALDHLFASQTEVERIIHRLPWGEAALTIIGTPDSWPACLAARYALERLSGWPIVAHKASEFKARALLSIQPRSLMIAVSYSGKEDSLLEAARLAVHRGATLLVVTGAPDSFLARLTNNVFSIKASSEEPPRSRTTLLEHAAALWLSVLAAKIFNPRHPQLHNQEQDFRALPERIDWMETHLLDVVLALAQEVGKCERLFVAGSALGFAVALHAPPLAPRSAPPAVQVLDLADSLHGVPEEFSPRDAFLFLSSSRSPAKHRVIELARRIGKTPARLFSFTDSNDRDLIDACEMSIMVPSIAEIPASLLELALLQWLLVGVERPADSSLKKTVSP